MNIKYWTTFSKKLKSTKQPTGGTQVAVTWKEETSIHHPVFILSGNFSEMAYVEAWGRYYNIVDLRTIANGLTEIECEEDRLASHRTEIISSSQYVLRTSDDNYVNGNIVDSAYPIQTNPQIRSIQKSTPDIFSGNSNTLLLTVMGRNGSQFVALNVGLYPEIARYLYNVTQDDIWNDLNVSALFTQTYLDPFAYIVDAKIFPIDDLKITTGTQTDTIYLGYWHYTDPDGVQIFRFISDNIIYESSEITLTPIQGYTSDQLYLNSNRFRKLSLTLPGVGKIELDSDIVTNSNPVKVKFTIDVAGTIAYRVTAGSNYEEYFTGIIAAPMAVHGASLNLGSAGQALGSLAGGIAAGVTGFTVGGPVGAVLGAGSALAMGAASMVSNAQPLVRTQTKGIDGSLGAIYLNKSIILEDIGYRLPARGPLRIGKPAQKWIPLSNLATGSYVQCENAAVDISGFAEDKAAIEALLNEGIYLD